MTRSQADVSLRPGAGNSTDATMLLLVLLLVALSVASTVAFVAWHYPTPMASPTPSLAAAKAVGREIGHHERLRRLLKSRLDPGVATGLALTVALGLVLIGGVVLATLAYLVRTTSVLADLDDPVAQWGSDHAGPVSEDGLTLITQLGEGWFAVVLVIVVSVVGYLRRPSRWIPVFMVTVLVGQWLLTNGIKELLDRVRPSLNPVAETLGPSFPSGHTTTAAAMWAAAALVLARGTSRHGRALLAGAAVGIAVAVACTRVFLDVHWLTDTIAGLFLGWAWFAVCAIAFGGRFLQFGAAAKEAVHEADVEHRRVVAHGSA
jgi:membrane-associated phospholipid phosphatase